MISLFRKIRNRVVKDGNISRYFLYAVGEILLVVIGILIALQVNNWNEQRKQYELEENYLVLLKEEIQGNIDFINRFYFERFDQKVNALNVLRTYYQEKTEVKDSLYFANQMGYGALFSTQAMRTEGIVFDEIVSTGNLKTISDENLRRSLMQYYSFMDGVKEGLMYYRSGYMEAVNSSRPFDSRNPDYISPFDASLMIRKAGTEEFYLMVNAELTYAYQVLSFMTRIIETGEDIITQIDLVLRN